MELLLQSTLYIQAVLTIEPLLFEQQMRCGESYSSWRVKDFMGQMHRRIRSGSSGGCSEILDNLCLEFFILSPLLAMRVLENRRTLASSAR